MERLIVFELKSPRVWFPPSCGLDFGLMRGNLNQDGNLIEIKGPGPVQR